MGRRDRLLAISKKPILGCWIRGIYSGCFSHDLKKFKNCLEQKIIASEKIRESYDKNMSEANHGYSSLMKW